MKYLGNDLNIVRDAALTATNIVGSNAVYRTDDAAKAGGGHVELSGDYTGASDATIDIKIVDTTISGTPKISAPSFSGIGNGTMTSVAADSSIGAQEFIVTLEDLGTATAKAYAPFQGVTLRAKASGAPGNLISITVDNSALAFAPTSFALQHDLNASTNEYTGDEWNFGAAILNPDLTIPDSAPRLSFGADPQIYRAYKFYRDGHYVYGFSPIPVRNVGHGTVVNAVSGTRTITIGNGTTTDTMTGVVSLYDALISIRDNSTLVDVIGAIVNDKTSGGQGAMDLSVWTTAYVIGIAPSSGDQVAHADLIVMPDAGAPTESLMIQCIDGAVVGGEIWSVRGDVSGPLANAITGALYHDGDYSFNIPKPSIGANTPPGQIIVEFVPTSRGEGVSVPSLCVVSPLIGSAARSGTWEFIWTKRPSEDCDCTAGNFEGGPSFDCLGIDPPGGSTMSAIDERRSRAIVLDRWFSSMSSFLRARSAGPISLFAPSSMTDTSVRVLATYRNNISILTSGRNLLSTSLGDICGTLSSDGIGTWAASHAYTVESLAKPVLRNGLLFRASVAGTSSSSEPTWPSTLGATVTDGGVTWVAMSQDSLSAWEAAADRIKLELSNYCLAKYLVRANTTAYGYGALIVPATANGHYYMAINDGGTTAGSPPTYPTTGGTVSDGTVTWQDMGIYWAASTAVAKGTVIVTSGGAFEARNDATTGSGSEPTWAAWRLTDGTVNWQRVGSDLSGSASNQIQNEPNSIGGLAPRTVSIDIPSTTILDGLGANYTSSLTLSFPADNRVSYSVADFTTAMKTVLAEAYAIAGLSANFKNASVEGDGCWQDFKDGDHWFAFNGTAPYLPIQVGHYYNSSQMVTGPDGTQETRTTKEFSFGPKFGCPELLAEGDLIRIIISGNNVGSHGYQQGDTFSVSVIHAEPIPFGGGQTGDDTLTFSVIGSASGRLIDYPLVTTALAPYSSTGGHLGFQITPGGIAFALGDSYRFVIEGGHFQVRLNGGSWSASQVIADSVSLTGIDAGYAGLSATFTGGSAPSWVVADQWAFNAEAVNGVDGIRQPTDARMQWLTSTVINIDPGATDPIAGILIGDHTIPSNAVITLLGSDDNFSTTPFSQVIPWEATHIFVALMASRATYRLTIDKGGSIQWLHLGLPFVAATGNGSTDYGKLTKHWRMPGIVSRQSLSATIVHEALSKASTDLLIAMLAHACEYDDGRIAIVPNDLEAEVGIVKFTAGNLDLTDGRDFQPRDTQFRWTSASLTLDPVS